MEVALWEGQYRLLINETERDRTKWAFRIYMLVLNQKWITGETFCKKHHVIRIRGQPHRCPPTCRHTDIAW